MSINFDDRTRAIVASNLTTALHVERASRWAGLGYPVNPESPKEWACGHPDASMEVFNTYLNFLQMLADDDGADRLDGYDEEARAKGGATV